MMKSRKKKIKSLLINSTRFGDNISIPETKKKFYFVAIRGFDISIDLERPESREIIEELCSRYEIEEPKRIVKKSQNNLPIPIINAKTTNINKYKEIIENGIKLAYTNYRVEKWVFTKRPTQCFNCKEIGHTKELCKKTPKCALCSGEHNFKDCNNKDNLKCVNCKGTHASFSRLCPFMNPVKEVQKPTMSAQNFIQPKQNYSNTNTTKINQFSSNTTIQNQQHKVKPAVEDQNQNTYATITKAYQNTKNEINLAQCSNSTLTQQNQTFKNTLANILTTITSLLVLTDLDMSNLNQIQKKSINFAKKSMNSTIKIAHINCRSLKNKLVNIFDTIYNEGIDISAINDKFL